MNIRNQTLASIFPQDVKNGKLKIPSYVTHIGTGAFRGCTGLTAVTLKHHKHDEVLRVKCVDGMLMHIITTETIVVQLKYTKPSTLLVCEAKSLY